MCIRDRLDIIHTGDCLEILKTLPDDSVHCCVTSPPYYALRDYGMDAQIGRETTPKEYISRLTEVFTAVSYTHLDVYKRQAAVLLLKSRGRTDDVFCEKEENGRMASSQSNRQLST